MGDESSSEQIIHEKQQQNVISSSSDDHSDASYSGPDEPILCNINNTVLRMCGIRNAKHRQFIMFHIEKLMNEHDVMNNNSSDDSENEVEIPPEFLCPITHQIMTDPVLICDGHSYERDAIQDWLIKHDKSPMTNSVLASKQ